jgi:hypothetical protein
MSDKSYKKNKNTIKQSRDQCYGEETKACWECNKSSCAFNTYLLFVLKSDSFR